MGNQFTKYEFSTVSTLYVSHVKKSPLYHPELGYLLGAVVGAYIAGSTFTGEPLPEPLLWLLVALYSGVGAIAGFTLYSSWYGRKYHNYELNLTEQAITFIDSFPDYWVMDIDTVKDCLKQDSFMNASITSPYGVEWKIVDGYKTDTETMLTLRRES